MAYLIRITLTVLALSSITFTGYCQSIESITGDYIQIDSTSKSYKENDVWIKDIDTTLLSLNKDMTFRFKWSPMFGPYSKEHIVTTGTWKLKKGKVILHSKYQPDEQRFFESYKPEYGDSLVKIYVQTYDSLIGFFQFQFIGVVKDTTQDHQMIFKDPDYPYNACSATFKLKNVDKIVFYGDVGRRPAVIPKDKRSNHFVLQFNFSDNWDYQYFEDFEVKIKGQKATLGKGKDMRVELLKR